jgi:hypothetical protein
MDNAAPVCHAIDSPYAWRMTAIAFVTLFVIFGVVYSFGAFFRPIATEFGANRARTSALFAITAGIYNALGLGSAGLPIVSGRAASCLLVPSLWAGDSWWHRWRIRSPPPVSPMVSASASAWDALTCRYWRSSVDGLPGGATPRWALLFPAPASARSS